MKSFEAVDIFAGAGGLSVGLKTAGFKVRAAVELEGQAFSTYKANHPEVKGFKQDVRQINGIDLSATLSGSSLDLFACCPPCQGFCSLTSKYRREDSRNALILEAARLILEMQPRAVMLENVPGLTKKGESLFSKFVDTLEKEGYRINWDILQVADYGIPQNRRRLVLLAGKGFTISLPKPTHSKLGERGLPKWKTLRSVIQEFNEPISLREAIADGGPQKFNWHVVRDISERNKARLRNALPGKSWRKIPKRLRPPCHQETGAGFPNVYGRLDWDQVPPTITGGCTTPSKGRFGHPDALRTISVREAATIQTFPRDYVFDTSYMEAACLMIGNALPCDFAAIIARSCMKALKANF